MGTASKSNHIMTTTTMNHWLIRGVLVFIYGIDRLEIKDEDG